MDKTSSGECLMVEFYFSGVELNFQLPGFRAVVDYIWSVYSVEKCLRDNFYRCTVHSDIHTVHSPTDAHLLKL